MPTNSKEGEDFYIWNTHTHLFTKDHVPEYLAKQYVPAPFYKWLKTKNVLAWLEKHYKKPDEYYTYNARNKRWKSYLKKARIARSPFRRSTLIILKIIVWIIFAFNFFQLVKPIFHKTWIGKILYEVIFPVFEPVTIQVENRWNILLLLLALSFSFTFVRKGIISIAKKRLMKLIGADRVELLMRYVNILRFSDYTSQGRIFAKLRQQYPKGSKFVVLPMDMEYMAAGEVSEPYLVQMKKLMNLKQRNKKILYPFVHVDPRRIEEQTAGAPFFAYDDTDPDNLKLKECLLKEYLEKGACGIKIYPALGYYPFNEHLLPLWLYCAQKDIPITTHCSVGPIFYRGDKKKEWDRHPVFEEKITKGENNQPDKVEKLRLQQLKNKDFQINFTHPLNYCCLLMPELLMKVLEQDSYAHLKSLFGYSEKGLTRDLTDLKFNLAHYGGSENWDHFLAKDRQRYPNLIWQQPSKGLSLKIKLCNITNLYSLWHYVDWFSIISSMMIEFKNVYADISYTTHDSQYLNLLSEIMNNKHIQNKVLYGTDFYVVSNQKTEKAYWIDMQNQLSPAKWRKLAFENPNSFI